MASDDKRLRRLYRLLDESGLHWLSDEVRVFALASPVHELSDAQVVALRGESRQKTQGDLRLETAPATQTDSEFESQPFDACVLYIIKRIKALAAYLEAAVEFARDLDICAVQLGSESKCDVKVTVRELREVAETIEEMVVT